jgi:hypothetical protein
MDEDEQENFEDNFNFPVWFDRFDRRLTYSPEFMI